MIAAAKSRLRISSRAPVQRGDRPDAQDRARAIDAPDVGQRPCGDKPIAFENLQRVASRRFTRRRTLLRPSKKVSSVAASRLQRWPAPSLQNPSTSKPSTIPSPTALTLSSRAKTSPIRSSPTRMVEPATVFQTRWIV